MNMVQNPAASDTPVKATAPVPATEVMLDHIRLALSELRYGAVQLTVHDGKLVQMDVTEKRRFQT
jgi:hypothetical protein